MTKTSHHMIYKFITAVALGLTVSALTSCAKSVAETASDTFVFADNSDDLKCITREYKNLKNFDEVSLSTGVDVTYQVGSPAKAVVTVSENVADLLVVEVNGGELRMGIENKFGKSLRRFKVKAVVTGPALTSVKVSSGADFNLAEGEKMGVSDGNLSLSASSGGDIKMNGLLKYNKISTSASSGADINISAVKVGSLSASASSGADINISGIDAESVSASSSSGADIRLSGTTREVSLSASSGADISARKLIAGTGRANASSSGDISCSIKNPTSLHHSSGGGVSNH